MTLLVTLFLVQMAIFNNLCNTSPNVEGFNAASAWIFSCLIFIFGALAAYAGILFKKRMLFKVSVSFNQKYLLRNICYTISKFSFLWNFLTFQIFLQVHPQNSSMVDDEEYSDCDHLDARFLITFPILFLIFNIIYWSVFIFVQ